MKNQDTQTKQWWRIYFKIFEFFCKESRIKRELTTPYNPQQNGVAERKNRTIMEVVKTMIAPRGALQPSMRENL